VVEIAGWVGGLLLSWCAVPQVLYCVRQGHAQGVSWAFLGMWGFGEIFTLAYVLGSRDSLDWPLLMNYSVNIVFISIIAWYRRK
jgi:uncharacterized protein with PQ loop repeat